MRELPNRIHRLNELANDLWWSWNRSARNVFRRLDYPLWRLTAHNPVKMLSLISNDALARAVANTEWLQLYDEALEGLDSDESDKEGPDGRDAEKAPESADSGDMGTMTDPEGDPGSESN